jgi:hypothetical protein
MVNVSKGVAFFLVIIVHGIIIIANVIPSGPNFTSALILLLHVCLLVLLPS